MSSASPSRLSAVPVLTGLFGLLFVATACVLLFLPGPRSPMAGLGVAGMGVVGVMVFKRVMGRARDTEMALDEAERYIEAVADLSQDIHAIIDASSRAFLYLNPAVSDLLGYGQEDFTRGGLAFFGSLVHPEDLQAVQDQFRQLVETRGRAPGGQEREPAQEQTFRARDNRGVYRWFKIRLTVFARRANGEAAELLAVVHDVTEQRSYEAALMEAHKHESLGALARGTLHDLNNTLMGIQGFTEIALEGPGDPGLLRNNLEGIQASLARATGLCRQMVAYTGNGRLQIAPRQLNDAVRESLPAIESMIPRGGHLELDLEEDLPLVGVDLNQVRYALLNLVYNAADAIRIGGGEIAVRTRVKQLTGTAPPGLEGAYVCLEVRDTGPGKPQEVMDRVYDPLFAAKWPGSGLGLSTVQGIMREHQGGVHTASALGYGDTTLLYFPVAGKAPELDSPGEAASAPGPGGVILLVDDEPTIRAVLRQGLEQAGFKVIEAGDGVEGFGAFVRHRSSISLVLLDLTMPRMGGEEVFEEIRKLAPDLPVVLMSGYSEQEATAVLASKGLAGFLPKPCSIRDALAVLRKALGSGGGVPQAAD